MVFWRSSRWHVLAVVAVLGNVERPVDEVDNTDNFAAKVLTDLGFNARLQEARDNISALETQYKSRVEDGFSGGLRTLTTSDYQKFTDELVNYLDEALGNRTSSIESLKSVSSQSTEDVYAELANQGYTSDEEPLSGFYYRSMIDKEAHLFDLNNSYVFKPIPVYIGDDNDIELAAEESKKFNFYFWKNLESMHPDNQRMRDLKDKDQAKLDNDVDIQFFVNATNGLTRYFPGWRLNMDTDTSMDGDGLELQTSTRMMNSYDPRMQSWYRKSMTQAGKNILVLLNLSGSMLGVQIGIAKATLNVFMTQLFDDDRFNIVGYNEKVHYIDAELTDGLYPMTNVNRRKIAYALEHQKSWQPDGMSNTTNAFIEANKLIAPYSNVDIIVISDGYMSVQRGEPIWTYLNSTMPDGGNRTITVSNFLCGGVPTDQDESCITSNRWNGFHRQFNTSQMGEITMHMREYFDWIHARGFERLSEQPIWSGPHIEPMSLGQKTEDPDDLKLVLTSRVSVSEGPDSQKVSTGLFGVTFSLRNLFKKFQDMSGMTENGAAEILGIPGGIRYPPNSVYFFMYNRITKKIVWHPRLRLNHKFVYRFNDKHWANNMFLPEIMDVSVDVLEPQFAAGGNTRSAYGSGVIEEHRFMSNNLQWQVQQRSYFSVKAVKDTGFSVVVVHNMDRKALSDDLAVDIGNEIQFMATQNTSDIPTKFYMDAYNVTLRQTPGWTRPGFNVEQCWKDEKERSKCPRLTGLNMEAQILDDRNSLYGDNVCPSKGTTSNPYDNFCQESLKEREPNYLYEDDLKVIVADQWTAPGVYEGVHIAHFSENDDHQDYVMIYGGIKYLEQPVAMLVIVMPKKDFFLEQPEGTAVIDKAGRILSHRDTYGDWNFATNNIGPQFWEAVSEDTNSSAPVTYIGSDVKEEKTENLEISTWTSFMGACVIHLKEDQRSKESAYWKNDTFRVTDSWVTDLEMNPMSVTEEFIDADLDQRFYFICGAEDRIINIIGKSNFSINGNMLSALNYIEYQYDPEMKEFDFDTELKNGSDDAKLQKLREAKEWQRDWDGETGAGSGIVSKTTRSTNLFLVRDVIDLRAIQDDNNATSSSAELWASAFKLNDPAQAQEIVPDLSAAKSSEDIDETSGTITTQYCLPLTGSSSDVSVNLGLLLATFYLMVNY